MITQEYLRSIIDYDPGTGFFSAKTRLSKSVKIGARLGHSRKDGYVQIGVCGERFLAHQLAFLWMLGFMPDQVDHSDRDRSNNKWDNISPATYSENSSNTGVSRNNKLRVKGVHRHSNGKFRAMICRNSKSIHLGYFNNCDDAHNAYLMAGGID